MAETGFHDRSRALLTGIAAVGFDLMALSSAFGETGNLVMAERLSALGAQLDYFTNEMDEALAVKFAADVSAAAPRGSARAGEARQHRGPQRFPGPASVGRLIPSPIPIRL